MKITRWILLAGCFAALSGSFLTGLTEASEKEKLKLLIIDGQNNHDWRATTPVLQSFLTASGRFTVELATTPTKKNAPQDEWDTFRPNFSDYDAVLSNYNGELWPEPVQKSLETYLSSGGALVIVHAANNAFRGVWDEWDKMIGLGWRGSNYGDRLTLDDAGNLVRTPKGEGPGAGHGPQHAFSVVLRDSGHPVLKGMPAEWMHFKDELYHGQRGPALNMHILATAYSAKNKRGTETHEPMVWWIPYGKGRVFTTVMGHADYSMQCVGFQTVVSRGCEWAATGTVTLAIPSNFPTAETTVVVSDSPELVAQGAKVEKLAGDFRFTEGPAVDKQGNIFFTDIPNNRIHKWSLDGKLSTHRENSGGANGLFFDKQGNLLACEGGNRRVTSISPEGKVTVLADSYGGKKLNSPNDLWIDSSGGLYFSDPRYGNMQGLEQDGFHVYYISPDRKKVTRVLDNLVKPNGVLGTSDGKLLYVADPGANKTYVYRIVADGQLEKLRIVFPEGSDGMTLDEDGNLYLTRAGIRVYSPNVQLITTIETPERPANVCFGGKDRKTLFITARTGFYSVRMNVRGQ